MSVLWTQSLWALCLQIARICRPERSNYERLRKPGIEWDIEAVSDGSYLPYLRSQVFPPSQLPAVCRLTLVLHLRDSRFWQISSRIVGRNRWNQWLTIGSRCNDKRGGTKIPSGWCKLDAQALVNLVREMLHDARDRDSLTVNHE